VQLSPRARTVLAAAAVTLCLCAVLSGRAHGQSVLSMRGGYYKERSTRVTQPMFDAQLQVTTDDRIDVHGLVDSITSASPAAGSATQFTERRYEAGVGYTRSLGALRLGGSFRHSRESDYFSSYGAFRAELDLAQKNTTLALTVGRGFDTITDGVSGGGREEELQVGLTSLSLTQVLGARLVGFTTIDVADLHGYQANIYRRVLGGDLPAPERVPDFRLRGAVLVGVRAFVPATATTLFGSYRLYGDDWGIVAQTLEARVNEELTPGLDLRLRYRFHVQGAADFYQDVYSRAQLENPAVSITEDQKLSAFSTHTVGVQVGAALGLVGVSGRLGQARLEAGAERVVQDNAFGNAWVAQLGVVVPLDD
jgi:hypothetical protein